MNTKMSRPWYRHHLRRLARPFRRCSGPPRVRVRVGDGNCAHESLTVAPSQPSMSLPILFQKRTTEVDSTAATSKKEAAAPGREGPGGWSRKGAVVVDHFRRLVEPSRKRPVRARARARARFLAHRNSSSLRLCLEWVRLRQKEQQQTKAHSRDDSPRCSMSMAASVVRIQTHSHLVNDVVT
jgi:hypothetical protein